MTSRFARLLAITAVGAVVSVAVLQRGYGWSDSLDQAGQTRENRQQARPERRGQIQTPPGPGPHLAFDVRPRDHERTTGYELEITHPSGKITTHDLEKPALQRRTIVVTVPPLASGSYRLVVIAKIDKGPETRSKPLTIDIPPA
jgi:hypothetical protein